jgi:hypothetical protein
MDSLYDQTLRNMGNTLHTLAARVPAPRKVSLHGSPAFRYVEKTIHQAMIQKLARVITGLHAARTLLARGFVQEQAALQRMLDEFHEDISFLAYAVIYNDHTPLHQKYLDAFYEEEFDAPSPLKSTQKRPMASREKIRAFVARSKMAGGDPSTGVELARTINKTYSGYVHGASPQIMDMYGGNPPRFHVHGLRGTELQEEHAHDLWNYFFRSIIAFGLVAKAFGDEELFQRIREYHLEFDKAAGRNAAFRGERET